MNWDFKQWSALAAAAESGSFEQAAAQLNITASAVSPSVTVTIAKPSITAIAGKI